MPGPRARRRPVGAPSPTAGSLTQRTPTEQAQRARPGTSRYETAMEAAGTTTPKQAAKEFVEKHVKFDPKSGLPALKVSAAKGISKAAQKAGLEPPSIASTVKELRETAPARRATAKRVKQELRTEEKKWKATGIPKLGPSNPQLERAGQRAAWREAWQKTPKAERPILKAGVRLAAAEDRLSKKVNTRGKQSLTSRPIRRAKKQVDIQRQSLDRKINEAAERGDITHPDMPHDAAAVIGELIPDSPTEIATLPFLPLKGITAGRAGLAAARAARAAEGGSRLAAAKEGVEAAKVSLTAAQAGKKGVEAYKGYRRAKRTTKGRVLRASAGGAAVGAAAATGDLVPAVKGTAEAVWESPRKVAETTGRGLASIPAAGIGAAAALGTTGKRLLFDRDLPGRMGSLDYAFTPTTRWVEENVDEAKKMFDVYTSGDTERIKKATQEDYGALPAISAGALLRGSFQGAAREAVARRPGGPGVAPGEPAPPIFQNKLPLVNREGKMKNRIAMRGTRALGEEGRHKARFANRIAKEQGRLQTAFTPKGRGDKVRAIAKSSTRSPHAEEMARFAEETGTPLTLVDLVNRAAENPLFNYRNADEARAKAREAIERTDPDSEDNLYARATLRVADVYDEPQFHKTVDVTREALKAVETSEDVPYFPVYEEAAKRSGVEGEMVPRPSEAVPQEARTFTDATTREAAVGRGTQESYRASDIRAARKELIAEYKKKNPDEAKVAALREKIKVLDSTMGPVRLTKEERRQALNDLPENSSTTDKRAALALAQERKREARDAAQMPALQQEFREGAEAILAAEGREGEVPAWFPHNNTRLENLPSAAPPHERAGLTKQKERLLGPGSIEYKGAVDYGAHRLQQAIAGGARRQAQEGFGNWLRDTITQTFDLGRGPQKELTKAQMAAAVERGEIDVANTYRVSTAFFDRPDKISDADLDELQGVSGDARASAFEDKAQKIEQEGGGDTYYIVDRKDMDAYLDAQKVMSRWEEFLAPLGRFESRALLATSFAWMTSQVIAEGGLLMATQSPYRLARALPEIQRIRKEGGDTARNLALIADSSLGTDPLMGRSAGKKGWKKDQAITYNDRVADGVETANKLPIGRYFDKLKTFEYPGEWDRAKGGFLREWSVLAEIDKQFNSRSREFARGLGETWTAIDTLSHKMKGKTLEEQARLLDADSKEPKIQAAVEQFMVNVDRQMGNWTAMSRAERAASHVLIFYPFLRFSVDWALRTFPADHPVRYAIATSMAQWNAEQLEDFLTKRPGFFTDWLQAPIYGEEEGPPTGFMSFSRVAPGSNAIVEAIGSGKSLMGALLGMSRPGIATLARAITKYNEFGEYDEEQTIQGAFGKSAVGLTFPGRTLKQAGVLEGIFGESDITRPSDTPGAPGLLEKSLRSGVWPFIPEDFGSAKKGAIADELWQQANGGREQTDKAAAEKDEMDKAAQFAKWKEDDAEALADLYQRRGLSAEEAEQKAKLSETKDVERYLKIGTKPDNPQREEYKRYLELSLKETQGENAQEEAKKKLIKLYGREGKKLTDSLSDFYSDPSNDIDTGRSGPRGQKEAGKKPMPAADILPRYTTNTAPKYGEEDRVRLNSKIAQARAAKGMELSKEVDKAIKPEPAVAKQLRRKYEKLTAKAGALPQAPGLKADPMGTYTPDEAATLLYQAGATKEEAETLSAYLMGESGGNPTIRNSSSQARGLFQFINSAGGEGGWDEVPHQDDPSKSVSQFYGGKGTPRDFDDPVISARAAIYLLRNGGTSHWEAAPGTPGRVNPKAKQGILAQGPTVLYGPDPNPKVAAKLKQIEQQAAKAGITLNTAIPSAPTVKNPNKRPFKGTLPVNLDKIDITRGMSEAKWDKLPAPGHGDTDINKAIAPIARAFQKKYGIMYGEGYAPPPSDHKSAEHLVTGTALDVYPRNENWDENSKEFKDFKKGIETLTAAGIEVLYDGSIKGTTPYPNHGYGNHAHIKWLGADGKTGLEALQKLTGMTNQQIANISASVGASGGGTSYAGGGGTSSGGGGTSGGGGGSTGGGGGGGSSSSSYSPPDLSKLSASLTIPDVTGSLPTVSESPSVMEALKKLPDIPKARRRKRTYV